MHVHHSHGHVYELARSFVVALTIDTALAVLTCHVRVVLAAPAVDELEPKLAVCDPLVPLERGVGTVPHKHAWLGVRAGAGAGAGARARAGARIRVRARPRLRVQVRVRVRVGESLAARR